MDWDQIVPGLVAFGIGLVFTSFMEYWIHRLMHHRFLLGLKHAEHHRDGWGQGWLGEFCDYMKGTLLLGWLGFLHSVPAGIGFAVAATVYCAWSAYAHQLQHENPDLVFWMKRPVHYLHHKHHMWRHNFGIAFDFWDRVFGTYQRVDWQRGHPIQEHRLRSYFLINWGYEPTPEAVEQAAQERGISPAKETEDDAPAMGGFLPNVGESANNPTDTHV